MSTEIPTVEQTVAAVQREILDGIADGTFPSDVATYSALHDYVDANCLGGMCDDEFVERFGEPDDDTEWPVWTEHVGQVQNIVDAWLRAGRPATVTARKRERIVASLRDQRLDVKLGSITPADYRRNVDETIALFAAAGVEPLPADVKTWGV